MFLTFDEIVTDLLLQKLTEEAKQSLKALKVEDLISLHSTFGMDIRNEYNLWDKQNPLTMLGYTPTMVGDVDCNPKHPDAMSHDIINAVWKKLQ